MSQLSSFARWPKNKISKSSIIGYWIAHLGGLKNTEIPKFLSLPQPFSIYNKWLIGCDLKIFKKIKFIDHATAVSSMYVLVGKNSKHIWQ